MKKWLVIIIVVLLVAVGAWYVFGHNRTSAESQFTYVEVTKGDLENTVSCTGTLSAVGTVDIGTQVSGTIDSIFVDFNDRVKKGQLLAVLDTTLMATTVHDAEAGVMNAEAQFELATVNLDRDKTLFERGLIAKDTYVQTQTTYKTAQASLQTAKASLARAKTNLNYAVIRSPIDGTVIQRNVEPGQTVAASLSTPTLFIIAEDLAKMEIHALVDESDIGQIKVGQGARFTVQAYTDETFNGVVRQIWLQPTTVQNVVTYTVVVDAENRDDMLLPGMTATVDFIIEEKKDVLLIPNSALSFTPTAEMLAEMRANRAERFGGQRDSTSANRPPFGGQGQMSGANQHSGMPGMPANSALVWYYDDTGKLHASPVIKGSTDGISTEIVRSRDIKDGMKVISSTKQKTTSTTTSSSSERRPGPPGRLF